MSLLLTLALLATPVAWTHEGLPLAAVVVELEPGSPVGDLARLRGYVELARGDAFSERAVRQAVELLHSTGEVEDVKVSTAATPGGLELRFVVRGAPRLAGIDIEGDPVVDADGAARLTRLRTGEPLWAERLDEAAQALAVHLAADGWLEARVRPRRQVSAAGARAVFDVTSGKRVSVRTVAVLAPGVPGAERLLAHAEPDPGEPYRRADAHKAAERLRRELVARGHWQARLTVQEAYDPAAAAMDVVFDAEPGVRVVLDPEGIPAAERERVSLRLREGGVAPDALDEVTEWVEDALRARGHRHPAAAARVEDDGRGQRTVRFRVVPGPRAEVASVRLEGGPDGLLLPLATRAGAPLEDRTLEVDEALITDTLRARGYMDPVVEAVAAEGGGLTEVVFRVRTGPRTLVTSVAVEVPVGATLPDAARPSLSLAPGTPYHATTLGRDRAALRTAWRNAGYPEAEVVPEVAFAADRTGAAIVLRVAPGEQVVVARIVVAGLHHTREEVVRRELLLREHDPLSFDRLVESQRRLGALGILQRVTITELDPERPRDRTLVVSVEEAPATTVSYGIGYAERDRLRGSVEVTRRNLFGMDRSLSGFARVSFRGSRLLATFREPYLFGRRQEVFLSVFREEDDRPGFDYVRWGGIVQTGRRVGERWNLIGRWAVQRTETFDVLVPCTEIDRQLCSSRVSGPSASAVRDTRDDPLDPRLGSFVGGDVQLSHRVLGGDGFVKTFLQGARYQPLRPGTVVAVSGRLGASRRLGGERDLQGQRLLPLPDRFFTGGDYGLRGHALDAVTPEGGNALLLAAAELRVELAHRVALALFGEAGNVVPLVSDLRLADLRTTAGVGLRYRSALGPLRVDWAFKLDRRPGESASRVHVTVGHAF